MGMFDEIIYKGKKYQTKSLYRMGELYEIRNDGTLWREVVTYEDRSDPNAKGLLKFAGIATKVHTGWEQLKRTGEVRFYWYEWSTEEQRTLNKEDYSAYFVNGALKELHEIEE